MNGITQYDFSKTICYSFTIVFNLIALGFILTMVFYIVNSKNIFMWILGGLICLIILAVGLFYIFKFFIPAVKNAKSLELDNKRLQYYADTYKKEIIVYWNDIKDITYITGGWSTTIFINTYTKKNIIINTLFI